MDSQPWDAIGNISLIPNGHQLNKYELLFAKIDDKQIELQVEKLLATKKANELKEAEVAPSKPEVAYEDFMKMDIRIATIIEAEKVPKTKKLVKLLLDTGIDNRTVVSGIAEYFDPENLIGKQVSVLVNLAPRKIKGIESQGMILLADNVDGLVFITPETQTLNGSEIK